jgi:hypothetical protein
MGPSSRCGMEAKPNIRCSPGKSRRQGSTRQVQQPAAMRRAGRGVRAAGAAPAVSAAVPTSSASVASEGSVRPPEGEDRYLPDMPPPRAAGDRTAQWRHARAALSVRPSLRRFLAGV